MDAARHHSGITTSGNASSSSDPSPTVIPVVVDLVTAEDHGALCDVCSDPIERGDLIALLSTKQRIHANSCMTELEAGATQWTLVT